MTNALMTVLLVGSALVNLLLASFIAARGDGKPGRGLIGVLLAVTIWSLAYAVELGVGGPIGVGAGDFKYVGIGAVPLAWLTFTLYWSGRSHLVNMRLVIVMLIEPLLILVLLAIPDTHDLIRYRDGDTVKGGWLFMVHLTYVMIVMCATSIYFVRMIARRAQTDRVQVYVLVVAVVLPFIASIAYNVSTTTTNETASTYDYTPVTFTFSCAMLTWGLIQNRLLKLAPIAYSQVVNGMADGVIVVDSTGHVAEANPAGLTALGWLEQRGWRGKPLPVQLTSVVTRLGTAEVRIEDNTTSRMYEAQVSDLAEVEGHEGGRLLVLRDISERRRSERERATLLAEQARVAETLSRSLRPPQLPVLDGVALGAEYRPAGAGDEIGGDFYDVYPVDDQWAFSLGDVSGKGARSAAVTALARYTLRALTKGEDTPSQTIQSLNSQIVSETEDQEIYLTIVHGRLSPQDNGDLVVTLTLGGHPRPLLVPADEDRPIEAVGEPGTAVGLLDIVETVDTEVVLKPGDALVSFTDGVSEARQGREFFGEEGLAEVLDQLRGTSASLMAEGVLEAVLRYQEDLAADDIALLVIQAPGVLSEIGSESNLELVRDDEEVVTTKLSFAKGSD